MGWIQYFLGALQILNAASPVVIGQLHGGAKDTAVEVQSALHVVNDVTSALALGVSPTQVIRPDLIHPLVAAAAAEVANQPG